jgi:hypothetical protein
MILDDTKWFAAQKRIRAELEPMADEMRKINCAVAVESEMERMVTEELVDWAWNRGPFASTEHLIKQFWNERLN